MRKERATGLKRAGTPMEKERATGLKEQAHQWGRERERERERERQRERERERETEGDLSELNRAGTPMEFRESGRLV
jgi:hypothetical protein